MLRNLFGFKKHYRDAREALTAGDFDAALAIYRERLAAEPERAPLWNIKIGELLTQLGRGPEAIPVFLAAAAALEKQHKSLQAITLYRAIIKLEPGNKEVAARLAELAVDPAERRAAERDPEGPPTMRTRLKRYAPLFSEFEPEELSKVVEVMQHHRFESGYRVFAQGEPGDSLFVVVHGEVLLSVLGADGLPVEVARLGEGSCFGEISARATLPRNVTADTTKATELLELSRDYLEAVAIAHPRIWTVLDDYQRARLIPAGV